MVLLLAGTIQYRSQRGQTAMGVTPVTPLVNARREVLAVTIGLRVLALLLFTSSAIRGYAQAPSPSVQYAHENGIHFVLINLNGCAFRRSSLMTGVGQRIGNLCSRWPCDIVRSRRSKPIIPATATVSSE